MRIFSSHPALDSRETLPTAAASVAAAAAAAASVTVPDIASKSLSEEECRRCLAHGSLDAAIVLAKAETDPDIKKKCFQEIISYCLAHANPDQALELILSLRPDFRDDFYAKVVFYYIEMSNLDEAHKTAKLILSTKIGIHCYKTHLLLYLKADNFDKAVELALSCDKDKYNVFHHLKNYVEIEQELFHELVQYCLLRGNISKALSMARLEIHPKVQTSCHEIVVNFHLENNKIEEAMEVIRLICVEDRMNSYERLIAHCLAQNDPVRAIALVQRIFDSGFSLITECCNPIIDYYLMKADFPAALNIHKMTISMAKKGYHAKLVKYCLYSLPHRQLEMALEIVAAAKEDGVSELDRSLQGAYRLIFEYCLKNKKYDTALDVIRYLSSESKPTDFHRLVECYLSLDNPGKAIEIICLLGDQASGSSYELIVDYYLNKADFPAALHVHGVAVSVAKKGCYVRLVKYCLLHNTVEMALEIVASAKEAGVGESDPFFGEACRRIFEYYLENKKYDAALSVIRYLSSGIKLDSCRRLSQCYLSIDNPDKAKEVIYLMGDQASYHNGMYFKPIVEFYLKYGHFDKALELVRSIDPKERESCSYELVNYCLAQKNPSQALEIAKAVDRSSYRSLDSGVYYNDSIMYPGFCFLPIVQYYLKNDNLSEALTVISVAHPLSCPALYKSLFSYYLLHGKVREALEIFTTKPLDRYYGGCFRLLFNYYLNNNDRANEALELLDKDCLGKYLADCFYDLFEYFIMRDEIDSVYGLLELMIREKFPLQILVQGISKIILWHSQHGEISEILEKIGAEFNYHYKEYLSVVDIITVRGVLTPSLVVTRSKEEIEKIVDNAERIMTIFKCLEEEYCYIGFYLESDLIKFVVALKGRPDYLPPDLGGRLSEVRKLLSEIWPRVVEFQRADVRGDYNTVTQVRVYLGSGLALAAGIGFIDHEFQRRHEIEMFKHKMEMLKDSKSGYGPAAASIFYAPVTSDGTTVKDLTAEGIFRTKEESKAAVTGGGAVVAAARGGAGASPAAAASSSPLRLS